MCVFVLSASSAMRDKLSSCVREIDGALANADKVRAERAVTWQGGLGGLKLVKSFCLG